MKRLMILVWFYSLAWAQAPDKVVQGFAWPDSVAQAMAKVSLHTGQQVVLTRAETMIVGYYPQSDQFLIYPVIMSGDIVEVWRVDHGGKKYFLLHNQGWYWKYLDGQGKLGIEKYSSPYTLAFDTDYWHGGYGSNISSSKTSLYLRKSWSYKNLRKTWQDVYYGGQIGLAMRYKPIVNQGYLQEIFMTRLRLDGRWRPVEWLEWYSTGTYYHSLDQKWNDHFWEVYNKFSFRRILGSDDWNFNLVYFGSQSAKSDWEYGEGKLQFIYYLPSKIWLGSEVSSANWLNNTGWRTQTRSKFPGTFIMGYWGDDWWWKMSVGNYTKESGANGISQQKKSEVNFMLLIGVKIRSWR